MRKMIFIFAILILIPLLASCKHTIPSNETINHTTENKTIENPSTATTPQTTPSAPEMIHTELTTPSTPETTHTEPTDTEPTPPPPVFEPPVFVPTVGITIIEDPLWWDTPYIEIYEVARDAFDYFLKNPSVDTLYARDMKKFENTPGFQKHWGNNRFYFESTLFNFLKDKAELSAFLARNGINIIVDHITIIDTPNIPMLLWARGGGESAFISIEEELEYVNNYALNDITYAFKCYTVAAFQEKFGCLYGSLKVNGKDVPNTTVRIYATYASDVPLMRVLEAFGAVIEKESDYLFSITFRGKQYELDLKNQELYEVGGKRGNLLGVDGGFMFTYSTDLDLMVDTGLLNRVMYDMDQKITTIEDRTNKVVIIIDRDE